MMALYGIAYDYVKNKITWRGKIYDFAINFSGLEIAVSSFTIPDFTGKTDNLFCAIPLNGFGNIKRDDRIDTASLISGLQHTHGPGFYYGIVSSFSNGSVDCADMKQFLNQDFVVERIDYTADQLKKLLITLKETLETARNNVIAVLDSDFGSCEKGTAKWGIASYNNIDYSDRVRNCLNGVSGMNLPISSSDVKKVAHDDNQTGVIGREFSLSAEQWNALNDMLTHQANCRPAWHDRVDLRNDMRTELKYFLISILGERAFYSDTKITVVYSDTNERYVKLVNNLNKCFADSPTKFNYERPGETIGYVVDDDDNLWYKYQEFVSLVKQVKERSSNKANYMYVYLYSALSRQLYEYAPLWATPNVNWTLVFRGLDTSGNPSGRTRDVSQLLSEVLEANKPGNQNGNALRSGIAIYLKDNPPAYRVNELTGTSDDRYTESFYYHHGNISTSVGAPGVTLSIADIDKIERLAQRVCDLVDEVNNITDTYISECKPKFNTFMSSMKNSRGYFLTMTPVASGAPSRENYWWIITGDHQGDFLDFYYGRSAFSFHSDKNTETEGWRCSELYYRQTQSNIISVSSANDKFTRLDSALKAFEKANVEYLRYSTGDFYVRDNNPLHYLTMIYDKWMSPYGSPLYIKWLGDVSPYIDRGTDGNGGGKHFTYPAPETAETQKLVNYVEALFKYYQITLQTYADEFTDPSGQNNPQRSDGTNRSVYAAFISGKDIGSIIIDKSRDIINPDLYVRPAMNGESNAVSIVIPQINKVEDGTETYDGVREIDTWYLRRDNQITRDKNDPLIEHPINKTLYIYSDTSKKPEDITDVEKKNIARAQLQMPSYSHEISFQLSKFSDRANEFCQIGNVVTLYYKGYPYKSAITSVQITSTNDYITVKCGNILSSLNELKTYEKTVVTSGGAASYSYSDNYVVMSEEDAKNLLLALNNSTKT